MPNKSTTTKKKRGRPANQKYFSASELRTKTVDSISKTAGVKGTVSNDDALDCVRTILTPEELDKQTSVELKELHRLAEKIWDQLQCDLEAEADAEWEMGYGVYKDRAPDGFLDAAAWEEEHAFLGKTRKNAHKPKNIFNLTEKQKLRKGLELEPTHASTLDIKAIEEQIEAQHLEDAIEEKKKELPCLKGRRVIKRDRIDPEKQQKKSFWT